MGFLSFAKKTFIRLSPLALGMLTAPAPGALACAVCGFGEDKSSQTFLYSTMVLSLVPLGLIGGILYWLYRSTRRREP
jgi:hypothetical protein